jgi:sulfoxide reductase catalytic subunit YedY
MQKIPYSEITPPHIYFTRREILRKAALVSASAGIGMLAACLPRPFQKATSTPSGSTTTEQSVVSSASTDELGAPMISFEDKNAYNNYYEFSLDKQSVARESENLQLSPWVVSIGGLVNHPLQLDAEEFKQRYPIEERIYRERCVEGYSMVVPWNGFQLSQLLKEVEPTSDAKFVRFETLYDPDQMPGQRSPMFDFPYVEGLRLDEAMHPLTILATGLYGKDLLPQTGAPLRLVVPWKYAFKSIKAIVKIDLVAEMPTSLWMRAAPNEYGFYANVNPNVAHPRWSQETELRLGEGERRRTLLFNGYEEDVAALYAGMDLTKWF